MSGKGKFGLLIGLALFMAVVSIVLINLTIGSEKRKAANKARSAAWDEFQKQAPKGPQGDTEVLVARQDIPAASEILQEMVETKVVPKEFVPAGAFSKLEDLNERISVHFIPAGDVFMPCKVKPKREISRASFLVEPGKRYITLPLEPAVQGVAAMIRIGDEVDILATYGDNPQRAVSKIIVQRAKVIDVAYGDSKVNLAQPVGEEDVYKRLGIGDTVTFQVAPEDAEMLKALEASGINYKYLLRNYKDKELVKTDGKRTRDVINGLFGIKEEAPAEAPPPPPAPNVF